MVKKYQKKPVVIEAVQWDGTLESTNEVVAFCKHTVTHPGRNDIQIQTLEGIMEVIPGDYIIKGIKGEFYPCKPDVFEQTYDLYIEVSI